MTNRVHSNTFCSTITIQHNVSQNTNYWDKAGNYNSEYEMKNYFRRG